MRNEIAPSWRNLPYAERMQEIAYFTQLWLCNWAFYPAEWQPFDLIED